jgi:hypothetical protein
LVSIAIARGLLSAHRHGHPARDRCGRASARCRRGTPSSHILGDQPSERGPAASLLC